jgi:hypothetical protein
MDVVQACLAEEVLLFFPSNDYMSLQVLRSFVVHSKQHPVSQQ